MNQQCGPPRRPFSAVAAREEGVPGWEQCGLSTCQCSPSSKKPTCRQGIPVAATGAGSLLAALRSGADGSVPPLS